LITGFLWAGVQINDGLEFVEDNGCEAYWSDFKGKDIQGYKLLNSSEYSDWKKGLKDKSKEELVMGELPSNVTS